MGGDATMAGGDDDRDEEAGGAGGVGQQGEEEEEKEENVDDLTSLAEWMLSAASHAQLMIARLSQLTISRP